MNCGGKNNPMSNAWFSTNIKYEGQRKAIFSNPPLVVEGYVKIQFDEFGNHAVIMNVEEVNTESSDIPNIPPEFKKNIFDSTVKWRKSRYATHEKYKKCS